ncbi:MAG: hypothetical protein MSS48_08075 [Clostridiales bacterium]|nr:hypothetical protein [Clostridiales bacterium]MCI7680148.1 hypothetical protein [Clostridiales bacterium]
MNSIYNEKKEFVKNLRGALMMIPEITDIEYRSTNDGTVEMVKVTYFGGGPVYINVAADSLEAIVGEVVNLVRGYPVVGLIHRQTFAQEVWSTLE